jgi:hypothetical protein
MERILDAARKHGVAMECNAAPERLDLKDVYLRMAKERGVPVVISTDAHTAPTASKTCVTAYRRRAAAGWRKKTCQHPPARTNYSEAALRPKPASRLKKTPIFFAARPAGSKRRTASA